MSHRGKELHVALEQKLKLPHLNFLFIYKVKNHIYQKEPISYGFCVSAYCHDKLI